MWRQVPLLQDPYYCLGREGEQVLWMPPLHHTQAEGRVLLKLPEHAQNRDGNAPLYLGLAVST